MISLTNYDFQWARSELVIIYPDPMGYTKNPMFFRQPGHLPTSPHGPRHQGAVQSANSETKLTVAQRSW